MPHKALVGFKHPGFGDVAAPLCIYPRGTLDSDTCVLKVDQFSRADSNGGRNNKHG